MFQNLNTPSGRGNRTGLLLTLALVAVIGALCLAGAAHAGTVSLPRTGQTTAYYNGDDGAIEAGLAWPNPRFTDNGDLTITDTLTGLVWLKDASTPAMGTYTGGNKTWQGALDYVAYLNTITYLGYNDWRLPNVNELESLATNAGQTDQSAWLKSQGFTNVNYSYYWSSTSRAYDTTSAWSTRMDAGFIIVNSKSSPLYVWPVRSGQSGAFGNAAIWSTGQTATYAAGDDGALQKGVAWPNPRFTANGNTVTDNLTSLIWTKDAGAPTTGSCKGGGMTWQAALDYVACLNTATYLGYTDWRLPNRKELFSLVDYATYTPPLPAGHPFVNVYNKSSYNRFWSSTFAMPSGSTLYVWYVDMNDGNVSYELKSDNTTYVWPVRGGQIAAPTYTVTGTVSSGNGTISCVSPVAAGATTTCTMTTNTGYALAALTDNGINVLSTAVQAVNVYTYTLSSVSANHAIIATFAQGYYVTGAISSGTGTISCTSPVPVGTASICTMTPPNTSYVLSALTDSGTNVLSKAVQVASVYTYTVPSVTANHTVLATFAQGYGITTYNYSGNGTGTLSCTPTTVVSGGSSTCTITPAFGYILKTLTDNNTDVLSKVANNTYTITNITAAHSIAATFSATSTPAPTPTPPPTQYTLNVTTTGAGTGLVTSSPGTLQWDGSIGMGTYSSGTSVTLTATANSGSTFTGWSGDCTGTGSCTVTMSATRHVTATFTVTQPTQYTLTATTTGTGSGTIAPNGGTGSYNSGTVVTLTATANPDSTFVAWNGCNSTINNLCTVTMNVNRTVSATFNTAPVKTYLLTVTKAGAGTGVVTSDNGTLLWSGAVGTESYQAGSTVTLTATAATTTSIFGGWSGCDSSSGNQCTITISATKAVTATFNGAPQQYTSSTQFGSAGSGQGQFKSVGKMAMAKKPKSTTGSTASSGGQGNLFVLDNFNNRVQIFDGSGNYQGGWGSQGGSIGQFDTPEGIDMDASNHVYIADTNNNRIQIFDTGGSAINSFGGNGSQQGMFSHPQGVAVDSSGNIYVADTGNHRIQKFDSNGKFISNWSASGVGKSSSAPRVLSIKALKSADDSFSPNAITIGGPNSSIYVTDTYSNQVVGYDTNGNVLSYWGGNGNGSVSGMFSHPSSIAVDNTGNVYVTDGQNNNVQQFGGDGQFISSWNGGGGSGGANGNLFDRPSGVAVDSLGNVFVAEAGANRIQKLTKTTKTRPAAIKALTGDLNGDGKSDIVWQDTTTGDVAAWLLNGLTISSGNYLSKGIPSNWQIVAIGDLNG
ncbi:MAG: DUF1566 domain-containing protein, partial [Nitrospirae bacterium]|nr:DUF1566 domain-containing protein [Nitrospirota bacterium]